jgi:hypothetical protein
VIKVILINPHERVITDVDVPAPDGNMDIDSICMLLNCELFCTAGRFKQNGVVYTALVDDLGMLKDNWLTSVDWYPSPLAGRILIYNDNEPKHFDLTVEDVKKRVQFSSLTTKPQ